MKIQRPTREQINSLFELYQRHPSGALSYREFRRRFRFASRDDYLFGQWCGMWVGIEKDGYTHT